MACKSLSLWSHIVAWNISGSKIQWFHILPQDEYELGGHLKGAIHYEDESVSTKGLHVEYQRSHWNQAMAAMVINTLKYDIMLM